MNVPIEIIILVLGGFFSVLAAFVAFFYKSIDALRNGFAEIKEILIENRVTNEFEHVGLKSTVQNHEIRINKLENCK